MIFLLIFSRTALTANQILAELEDLNKQADVFVQPPDEDDLTDGDSGDEDEQVKDLDHIGKGILAQPAQLVVYMSDDEEEEETEPASLPASAGPPARKRSREDREVEPQPGPSRTRSQKDSHEERVSESDSDDEEEERRGEQAKLARTKNTDRPWGDVKTNIFGMAVPDLEDQPLKELPEGCKTPFDFFTLFVTDEFVENISELSKHYAVRKGREDLLQKLSSSNIRLSHAIMFMSGYMTPAYTRMYWEDRTDSRLNVVREAMTRNTFEDVLHHTHFTDRQAADPNDRFWKVRILFNSLNETAKQYVKHPSLVSVDEGMVKYFGPHPMKQFIRGKPCRFGFKVWILASSTGELLACQPYGGSSTHIPDYGLGQGPNVVMGLTEQYGLLPGSKVYADNLFITMDLLEHMGDRQLGITGTMRQNRLVGVPLPSKKLACKEMKRGEHKVIFSMDSNIVLWMDNQPVFMASNVDTVEPARTCQRYSKVEKKYVSLPQPNLNHTYNQAMGGVDLLDAMAKKYAITTRLKKWYWCFYGWYLNVSMVQAWRLFRAHFKELHQKKRELERVKDAEWEEEMINSNYLKATVDEERRERDREKRRSRAEEKKLDDIPLLEFTRQVVEMTFIKFSRGECVQREARMTSATLAEVRYDSGRHLVRMTKRRGVCKECKNRTTYRCIRCDVALHPDECFYLYHVPVADRVAAE